MPIVLPVQSRELKTRSSRVFLACLRNTPCGDEMPFGTGKRGIQQSRPGVIRTHNQGIMSANEPDEQVVVVSWSCEFFGNGACRSAQDFGAERVVTNSLANSSSGPLAQACHPTPKRTASSLPAPSPCVARTANAPPAPSPCRCRYLPAGHGHSLKTPRPQHPSTLLTLPAAS